MKRVNFLNPIKEKLKNQNQGLYPMSTNSWSSSRAGLRNFLNHKANIEKPKERPKEQ